MKFIKNIFFLFIIIFVLYILGLFIFPEKVKNFWDSIWLSDFNNLVLELKNKSDSWIWTDLDIKNLWSWVTEALDTATNYAKDIKSKVDSVRSTASWISHTYNEVKTQVETTKKALDDANTKVQEIRNSIENVTNIIN